MKVLLIYPQFPDTFWSFTYALSFIGKKSAFPPLGLLTVASLLPEGWPRRLVDVNVERLTDDDLHWADLVFVGGMAVQRKSAEQIIARCRAKNVRIVAGGPLFTAESEQFSEVDHLVLDEAELTLPIFLDDLEHGRPQRVYRAAGFCSLQDTPVPAWDLIKTNHYASLNIQFSRGCPFSCEFCNVTTLFGHRSRIKTPQQVITELNRIYATGWRGSIFFVDDNFIGNKEYLKTDLLPALIAWRRDKTGCVFFTEASINLADDPQLLNLMVLAGFDSVFIGIESPDEISLTECHKVQNKNRDLLACVKRIHRSGLQVMGGFIVGFDNDPPSIFQRQIDFIQKSGIVIAMVGMLQAPPGTRLFERLQRESRISTSFSGDNVDGTTNIVPRMGLDLLVDGYRSIMQQIYTPKNYYRRVRTLLRDLKAPKINQPLNLQRFLSFFRSAFRLGFIGKERVYYWQLLLWTLSRRPRLVPTAITLTIYGYHYRKICELYIDEAR
ncbi:B12-binding domain-containing radical SAM protein [Desulfofustis limnaeus]|uniref:B12-binding domain-containing radical SAM protein n=1 Tax=Desulfofustis limnaeus TaxID=2740163 RepID=A0ABM7WA75_9BACT|nr:B12-binding domain-containing radical SAM protein [Desulfofustis limnaeus]BDD87856.1 B12-binding domain-containing radical SAM protein [Desulfofustis limnaeus]